jgi:hypothetical protein
LRAAVISSAVIFFSAPSACSTSTSTSAMCLLNLSGLFGLWATG